MSISFRGGILLVGAALAAGCSTVEGDRSPRGISVTRTHLGGVAARGEVAVEPRFDIQAAGGVYQPAFADAVAGELRTLGFAPAATPAPADLRVVEPAPTTGLLDALIGEIAGTFLGD